VHYLEARNSSCSRTHGLLHVNEEGSGRLFFSKSFDPVLSKHGNTVRSGVQYTGYQHGQGGYAYDQHDSINTIQGLHTCSTRKRPNENRETLARLEGRKRPRLRRQTNGVKIRTVNYQTAVLNRCTTYSNGIVTTQKGSGRYIPSGSQNTGTVNISGHEGNWRPNKSRLTLDLADVRWYDSANLQQLACHETIYGPAVYLYV
jgi:hypothetical protein